MVEKKEPKAKETKTAAKEPAPVETQQHVARPQGNFVYIGKKGAMAYVLAVVTQFGSGADEVIIKARGKSISRAVDVAEIVRNRETTIELKAIGISTEEVVTQDGRPLKISSIEIVLKK